MLYLAMSCFQSRPQQRSYDDLLTLNPDGIQLTPGNIPTPNFREQVKIPHRLHHNFSWDKYRRDIYDQEGNLIVEIGQDHSIHPPKSKVLVFEEWIEKIGDHLLEVMYPGYFLGCGREIEIAMSMGIRLAVDISHLWIMKCQGVINETTVQNLLNYDKIEEIHISQNSGKYDNHRPIHSATPYLDWVKERKNLSIVFESYLHRLIQEERRAQIELVREILQ